MSERYWFEDEPELAARQLEDAVYDNKKAYSRGYLEGFHDALNWKRGRGMEPEYVGWCRGCNSFSEHLKLRSVRNNNTGTMELSMFCDSCRKRFGLFPYDKQDMPDAT